ncbi:MAG: response regulator [Burkholderiales bacterium]
MKILIVAKDQRDARFLSGGLVAQGYQADISKCCEQSLLLAHSSTFDLIVADLEQPGIEGVDLCQRLRRQKNGIPLLILSARAGVTEKVAVLHSGADDYLAKPYDFD